MNYIALSKSTIESEHICCAFSDKKCRDSYEAKKTWLSKEFDNGYVFRRLDERAKVFIEYGPAESAWLPIEAPGYLALGCFWVSGKYKNHGHGKQLLAQAVEDAKQANMRGLVAVVGKKKNHFMSDTKWLLNQGFIVTDTTESHFALLSLTFEHNDEMPKFSDCVRKSNVDVEGCVVYYSNRCPYSEYHVTHSLVESCHKREIALKVIKLETKEMAQSCPSPATIFSLYYNGMFITTDISACMDSRFDRFIPSDKE